MSNIKRPKCKVSILVLVYNAPFYTLQTLLGVRLRTYRKDFDYEIVVVDNASRLATRLIVRTLRLLSVIDKLYLNSRNDLFSGGNNIASRIADKSATHFLLLNSDIKIIDRRWLQKMLDSYRGGIVAYGVCESPSRVDGYCYLIDAELYRKYPLDEDYQWWWSLTKQQSQIMQEYPVVGLDNHDKYIHHYGGKSGNLENVAKAKGMKVDMNEVVGWFKGKRPTVIDLERNPSST